MDITLDITKLLNIMDEHKEKIKRCRIWRHTSLNVAGNIKAYQQPLW